MQTLNYYYIWAQLSQIIPVFYDHLILLLNQYKIRWFHSLHSTEYINAKNEARWELSLNVWKKRALEDKSKCSRNVKWPLHNTEPSIVLQFSNSTYKMKPAFLFDLYIYDWVFSSTEEVLSSLVILFSVVLACPVLSQGFIFPFQSILCKD